ncbi:MAG: cyanophycinase [Longimicrobiales bacterium]|nr:cyanophycinase [Longimicrobiales bacterium]
MTVMRDFNHPWTESRDRGPVATLCSVVLAATLSLAACGPSSDEGAADASADPSVRGDDDRGRLVIVGGALDDDNAPVWQAVLEGRQGQGPVCVIPTASGVPERSMQSAMETLDRYGGPGTTAGILITDGEVEAARDPGIAGTLLTCSGFWFTGGAQSRIVDTFLPDGSPTAALEAIRERFREGAVIAGSSAGAAMMSHPMIAGGSSEGAFTDRLRTGEEEDGVRIYDGLGFFQAGVLDQHFLARGRIGRLLVAVREHPEISAGFGIDENTAMVVDGDAAVVVGASGVVLVDGRGSAGQAESLRMTLAGAGDRIDLATLSVTFDPGKQSVESGPMLPTSGIFEDWVFLNALAALSASSDSVGSFDVAGGRVSLAEGEGFRAVASTDGDGIAEAPPGLSAGPFETEVVFTER